MRCKCSHVLTSYLLLLTFFARTTPAETPQPHQASAIAAMVQKAMKTEHLRGVIVKVTQGDKVVISQAFGESIDGVPATTAMHFRNGAVAFTYLGTLLSELGGKPLDALLREKVLGPMGLKNTVASQTSEIPSPVLHAFDSERRTALKIPSNISFYEESTFWNPQWGTPIGANETT